MSFFFILFYNIVRVPLYLLIFIAGLFHVKIHKTIIGRRGLFCRLTQEMKRVPNEARRIWIHISSMGEFEQGLPLLKVLMNRYPNDWFVVSLFSPSVYDHMKWNHPRAIITYLPFDSYSQVKRFLNLVRPSLHLVIRHDIWPNYQWVMQSRRIPSILVNASISDHRLPSMRRFKYFYRQIYNTFSAVCAVSAPQLDRLGEIYRRPENIYVCGDTRFDRVMDRALDTDKIRFIMEAIDFGRSECLVVGSSWPSDEEIILPALVQVMQAHPHFRLILAPHEIEENHLDALQKLLMGKGISVSRLAALQSRLESRVLLIDRIGLLANLYALGQFAMVGGGFGPGVHNVLEPAAHGAIVFYGPKHYNSPEARAMIDLKIAFSFSNSEQFAALLSNLLGDPPAIKERSEKTKKFIDQNAGASSRTTDVISRFL